jgi:acetyl-CoA synthetase
MPSNGIVERTHMSMFADLPKTISGKIRRVELRGYERDEHPDPDVPPAGEFREEELRP